MHGQQNIKISEKFSLSTTHHLPLITFIEMLLCDRILFLFILCIFQLKLFITL